MTIHPYPRKKSRPRSAAQEMAIDAFVLLIALAAAAVAIAG